MPTVNYAFHYSVFINPSLYPEHIGQSLSALLYKKIIGNSIFIQWTEIVKSNNTDSIVNSVRTEVTAAVLNVTQQFQHFQGD